MQNILKVCEITLKHINTHTNRNDWCAFLWDNRDTKKIEKEVSYMPEMTHQQELNLERFANLMVELIEKHSSAVDKSDLEKINIVNFTEGAVKTASSVALLVA